VFRLRLCVRCGLRKHLSSHGCRLPWADRKTAIAKTRATGLLLVRLLSDCLNICLSVCVYVPLYVCLSDCRLVFVSLPICDVCLCVIHPGRMVPSSHWLVLHQSVHISDVLSHLAFFSKAATKHRIQTPSIFITTYQTIDNASVRQAPWMDVLRGGCRRGCRSVRARRSHASARRSLQAMSVDT
jgi:hypothetical protein